MTQLSLFGDAPQARGTVAPAPHSDAVLATASRLPRGVYLGTSSWSFPGWQGLLWRDKYSDGVLSRKGLTAYSAHPLLRTVGIDRTHYAPVTADVLRAYAEQVPPTFRFLAKAHELCSLAVLPDHPRYGAGRGQPSPYFLDASYARDAVVAPFVDGLGGRAGVLLFQFAAQPIANLGGGAREFAERLFRFLRDLPRGPHYAVEVRNKALLGDDYAAALRSTGVAHCINLIPGMPSPELQQRLRDPSLPLVIRWLLAPGFRYDDAKTQFAPFDRVIAPDLAARRSIATLVNDAAARDVPAYVIVNNKAEGSAPLSIQGLAELLADDVSF